MRWFNVLLIGSVLSIAGAQNARADVTAADTLPLLDSAQKNLQQANLGWLQYHLPVLQPVQREPLLYILLSQYYQQKTPLPQTLVPWMQQLAGERPTLMEQVTIDGYLVTRPRYDYPSLARAILSRWRVKQREARYTQQLQEGTFPWQSVFNKTNPQLLAQQQAVVHAFAVLTQAQLQRIVQRIHQHRYYFPDNSIGAALALQLHSQSMLRQLFAKPVDQYSIDALNRLATRFNEPSTLAILIQAAQNPEMTYHAFTAIARLAKHDPKAGAYLQQQRASEQYKSLVERVLREQKRQTSQP